jgi:hypothetical protein
MEQYVRVAPAMHSHVPPACRCPMMNMWMVVASSVPGLVVSALSVSDVMTCLCLVANKVVGCFIGRGQISGV